MPNLREKTWTPTTPAKTEDANFWEDHLIDDESYEGLQNLLEGGGAGHEIQDADGNTMPQQPVIQFINAEVTNGDGKTIVSGNGQRGPKGDPGDGVPSGGTTGQIIVKTDTGTAWADPPVTHYYAATLGAASATSDSTVYSGGYKLTISNSTITANSTAVIFFPSGDYSGNVTWATSAGKVDLYFDQNPNSKAIRVEWKTLTYSSATIS